MHWSDKYIGLSYDNYNCAELVALVMRKEFSMDVVYNFEMPDNVFGMSREIKRQLDKYLCEPSDKPIEGGCVLMSGTKSLCHIGVCTKIRNTWYVLHCMKSAKQCIRQKMNSLATVGLRSEGVYRWQKLY